jgi:ketosteroid isomerase-like protein
MYHAVVRRLVRWLYRQVSERRYMALVRLCAPDVVQVVPGDSALGGTRRTREAYRSWFQRLFRLFASLQLEPHEVIVEGWPWSTRVAVQWTDRISSRDGRTFHNRGAHFIRLRWGRLARIEYYWDTQLVAEACAHLVSRGLDEGAAPPLAD